MPGASSIAEVGRAGEPVGGGPGVAQRASADAPAEVPSAGWPIDAGELRALGASLMTPELVLFPVRHHSPACALQLLRLIAAQPPCEVLVEGPREFDALLPLLVHSEARMPLAIYSWAVRRGASAGEPEPAAASPAAAPNAPAVGPRPVPPMGAGGGRSSAYYPFCDASPELVALREANRLGVPARFIDLDWAEQCQAELDAVGEDQHSLLEERHLARSRHLQVLAARLGCRDHEELWEHLFEVPAVELEPAEHVARVAAYCALARRGVADTELLADGTAAREAEMTRQVRQALRRRQPQAGPVLVVLGGFHAVVLPALLADPLAEQAARPTLPRGEIVERGATLIRYSFERLDRLNGYAAGMTSPAWQQALWERLRLLERPSAPGPGPSLATRLRREVALGMLSELAVELRSRHGLAVPVPALAAAYQQALGLAALRGRRAPARDDVLDAVTSCYIKGDADADGAIVRAAARRIFCGAAVGRVPPGGATPPLVRDFQLRARRQRLRIDDSEPRRVMLDLYRRPEHRVTSRMLHGLELLGVPFALRTAGPDFAAGRQLERLHEQWEYVFSPLTEGALVEASAWGMTLLAAVANRFAACLDELAVAGEGRDARSAASWLARACVLGLHEQVPRVVEALSLAIGEDADFVSVVAAASSLALLWESREPLEAKHIHQLPALLRVAYERAIFLGGDAGIGTGAGHGHAARGDGGELVAALAALRELLVSQAGHGLDASLYWALIARLAQAHREALVRGAASGLLYAEDRLPAAALGLALAGHLTGLAEPRTAVAFLRGLLLTAREVAWQQPELLAVLDRLLRQWDDPGFVAVLPELRLAFAEMTPKETDRIAAAVARLHGGAAIGPLVHYDLAAEEVAAHLAVAVTLREVLTTDGLGDWVAP